MAYFLQRLEATPDKATRHLSGIGAVATIRTLLAEAGMTDEAIIEGRDYLCACLAAPRGLTAAQDTDDAKAQRAAVAELDQWGYSVFYDMKKLLTLARGLNDGAMLFEIHPAFRPFLEVTS